MFIYNLILKEKSSKNKRSFSTKESFDLLRLSNTSLPLIQLLPLKITLAWTKYNDMFFFSGWKTLLYSNKLLQNTPNTKSLNLEFVPFDSKYNKFFDNVSNAFEIINSPQTQSQELASKFYMKIKPSSLKEKKAVCHLIESTPVTITSQMNFKIKQKFKMDMGLNESNIINKYTLKKDLVSSQKNVLNKQILNFRTIVWSEIYKTWQKKQIIYGRFLNTVNGGYSIGIAGYVAFLPKSRWYTKHYRLGSLESFYILNMNSTTKNIVVTGLRNDKKII